ncbi:MAG: HEAT repeat domain-containing protein [Desulfomonile tiedjei]|nr:HEAT repeat domain-containing protein [Desulfomonile tiedjei]
MRRFLEKRLKVYEHEAASFEWLAVIFFAIFFVTAIFRNYVDTAFLKRYGPEWIPWMLTISALLTIVVLAYADRIAKRFSDTYLMLLVLGGYAVGAALCWLMVKSQLSIVYPILYQLMGLLDSMLLVYLWNIAGDLFDARQGKRIFPLVTAAQVLGTTVGSFATRPITHGIGEDAALLVFGAVFLLTALFMAKTSRGIVGDPRPKQAPAKKQAEKKRLTEIPGIMKQYPIVRFLIICGLIPNVLLPIFSYQFSVIANSSFASEQSLITFLSVFRGSTTLVTFLILFFVGRLYTKMGLPNASLVQPVNFAIVFAGLTTFFNIYVAAYGQFTAILIQRAIAGPVNKILFSVIPKALAAWSRTFIRGTVLKVGMLAGSLTMILLKPVMQPHDFAYIAAALAVYWVFETLLFRKEYKRILKQVIVADKIDFDQVEAIRTFDAGGAPVGLESATAEMLETEKAEEEIKPTAMAPDIALKLLDDPSPSFRTEAALALAVHPDMRGARKLIRCLEDLDDEVRTAAMEALIAYPAEVLPFLEASLLESSLRGKQAILEVIRLAPAVSDFEMTHLFARSVEEAYGNLIVVRRLQELEDHASVQMLKQHLLARNDEILSLLFYALWVFHADMRLMYQALKSENASVAIEMVETSLRGQNLPYLVPLIDDLPLDEKIEKGRKLFNLVARDQPERLLALLAHSEDRVTRTLAVFVMADLLPNQALIPVIESLLEDRDPFVRQVAEYASAKAMGKEAQMPEILDIIHKLKTFALFEGLGAREVHAVASITKPQALHNGDIIIRSGEENPSIYLVLSGKIVTYQDYQTPQQKELRTTEQNGYLNFVPMFTHLPPANTSVVTEDAEVLVLPQSQFHEIMRVYPQIGLNLLKLAAMMFRQLGITA